MEYLSVAIECGQYYSPNPVLKTFEIDLIRREFIDSLFALVNILDHIQQQKGKNDAGQSNTLWNNHFKIRILPPRKCHVRLISVKNHISPAYCVNIRNIKRIEPKSWNSREQSYTRSKWENPFFPEIICSSFLYTQRSVDRSAVLSSYCGPFD